MSKRHNAQQKRYIDGAEKTYGEGILVNTEDIARLEHPDDFGGNKSREYNRLVENAQLAIKDLIFLLDKLPLTYKQKILSYYNTEPLVQMFLYAGNLIEKQVKTENISPPMKVTKDEYFEPYSYSTAIMMFNHSSSYIINQMPSELQDSLRREIFPFVTLVNSIARFVNRNLKTNYPIRSIPHNLIPTELPGSNPFESKIM